jgi:hypothetical protein
MNVRVYIYIYFSLLIMVGVTALTDLFYCQNDKICLNFSFGCVYVFVSFLSFARAYFGLSVSTSVNKKLKIYSELLGFWIFSIVRYSRK